MNFIMIMTFVMPNEKMVQNHNSWEAGMAGLGAGMAGLGAGMAGDAF